MVYNTIYDNNVCDKIQFFSSLFFIFLIRKKLIFYFNLINLNLILFSP